MQTILKLTVDERINALDLSDVGETIQKEERLTRLQADFYESLYRDFLRVLHRSYSVRVVPDERIDTFWHAHIATNEAYERDMIGVFGRVPIHDSNFYGTPEWREAWAKTRQLFTQVCGYDIALHQMSDNKETTISGSASYDQAMKQQTSQNSDASYCSGGMSAQLERLVSPAAYCGGGM